MSIKLRTFIFILVLFAVVLFAAITLIVRSAGSDPAVWHGEDAYFDPVVRRFLDALRMALPHCDERDLFWSYHFLSGALTLTFAETGCGAQRGKNVLRGPPDGTGQVNAPGQFNRDGTRQRAAGAVGMPSFNSLVVDRQLEPAFRPGNIQHVDHLLFQAPPSDGIVPPDERPLPMPSFCQQGTAASAFHVSRYGLVLIVLTLDGLTGKRFQFCPIWRRQCCDAGEPREASDGRLVGERRAARRHHDGVEDDRHSQALQPLGDRLGGFRRTDHADLDRVGADVAQHRIDLRQHHVGRHRHHRLHAERVLRGDRGDRRHPMHAAAREGLQVGLDPGAATGVRAGDREHGGYA